MIEGEIILWAAVLGLLIGIIWALRYVIKLDRKVIAMHEKIERSVGAKVKKASKPAKKKK